MDLDDVFLIDRGDDEMPPIPDDIKLDEVNTLDTVIRLSLEAYKAMMDDISFIEVKNRVRHLEVADRYLKTATDALYKKESLITARNRLQKSPTNSDTTVVDSPQDVVSRDELYEKRRQKLSQV